MRIHELHAPCKVISRGAGRSSTAAAAYRSASRIEDERTGQVHDYTRKQGVEADALLLPDNAPDWAHDRAKLWNAAEQREAHPRAQTARDLTVSFPSEFSPEQRQEAGLRIGQWIVMRYGAAVDIAWHDPSREGDQRNHHAHFLFTTRRFDENGEWAKTKDRNLDDLRRGPEEIKALRLGVADALNNIATRDKLDVYVEHLSFEKRGLDQEPTQHMGPIATGMERDGVVTDIGTKNREIKNRNEQRQSLRDEQKVIDIEIARERFKEAERARDEQRKAAALKAEQDARADAHAIFYRETQERRAAMLDALERQHGAREKELQREIAGLTNSLENAGFFARIWRGVTGRTRDEREQLATATRAADEIQRQRQAAHESFERDRQIKLEAIKAAQQQLEAQRAREAQQPLARAAGGPAISPAPSQPAQTRTTQLPSPAPASDDAEARRRAYFQRLGAQRKDEREREQPRAQPDQARSPAASGFEKAAQPEPPQPANDQQARREAYMRRMREQRERKQDRDGPKHER